jgi:hypothetical protein
VEAGPNQPPVFMVPLEDVGLVAEGTKIHVEARVEPKNDPQLRIEWELNGKVISTGRERGSGVGEEFLHDDTNYASLNRLARHSQLFSLINTPL